MRTFLINVKSGLVIGGYSRKGHGWHFQPYTCAHGGSRKAHATKAAASLRYTSPYCVDIEATGVPDAARIAKERKAAFEAKKPCCGCVNNDGQDGCIVGAAPLLARTIQFCAKFFSEEEGQALTEAAIGHYEI